MRFLLSILLLLGLTASAFADKITARVAITNAAGTTNGQTITVNGNVRTWTNNVQVASSQIGTNATAAGSKTNAYTQIALNPFAQVTLLDVASTNFDLVGASGLAMSVTLSAGYGTVVYSTQTVATVYGVRVPLSSEPTAGLQTNVASLLVKGENDLSTNSFYENATAVQNLVGLTNAQTVAGIKLFTNAAGVFSGNVSNAASIGGTVYRLTNGIWYGGIMVSPIWSNAVNYGSALSSAGAASASEQFGGGALALLTGSTAVGNSSVANGNFAASFGYGAVSTNANASAFGTLAIASGANSTALGTGASATNTSSTALGVNAAVTNANSTAVGQGTATTADHQVRLGTSSEWVSIPGGAQIGGNVTNLHAMGTNTFAVGADISFGRYALTTLANGINQDIIVGTNVFVEVSGPSAAFSIEGIAGGRDGKFLIILNQTGFNMTIATEGGATGNDPTAANRIISLTGADQATTGNGAAMLIYNASTSRWILLNLAP